VREDCVATVSRTGILSVWEMRSGGSAELAIEIDLCTTAKCAKKLS
jgi:hypothetical protein